MSLLHYSLLKHQCEEVLFEAKSRRDKTSRGKQEAAVRLERVMADMHAVVATIDAAGPTVKERKRKMVEGGGRGMDSSGGGVSLELYSF